MLHGVGKQPYHERSWKEKAHRIENKPIERGEVKLKYVRTEEMHAGYFTKRLLSKHFGEAMEKPELFA